MIKKILLLCFSLLLINAGAAAWWVWSSYQTLFETVTVSEPTQVVVEPGDHLKKVAHSLAQRGIIRDARALYWYGRYTKMGRKIKVGEFELQGEYTAVSILETLTTNQVKQYGITFVEGVRLKDMLATLRGHPKIRSTLDADPNVAIKQVVEQLGIDRSNPEGLFFPSTYQYPAETEDRAVLERAYKKMQRLLEKEWAGREKGLPYKSPYEALIMASIIEKESGVPEERDEIAGVFVRRMKRGMRLQTDPTIIYGLGDSYKGNITRAHLRSGKNPYNTYKIDGLPPTPIAMPGAEAVHAALHPKPGKSLYFVAKGDGTHQFSATLKEHNAAVRQYQLRRRKDYRSSR